jgi:hypothetical protein
LRSTRSRSTAEHRGEQIAKATQAADVEVLHARARAATRTTARGVARPATTLLALAAESSECAKAAHLVVLLALLLIAQDVVRLGDLLESIGRLRIALVRIGVVLLCETAIGLLDLFLRRGRGHPEDLVVILALGHSG